MKMEPINEKEIKQQGWSDRYIAGYSEKVHIFHYYAGEDAKNIIILHTPVVAIKNLFECYEQLGRIYNFNVFALDYVPGEGECSGSSKEFTLPAMVNNIDAVYNYVAKNYSDDIHLLGYTGVGGMMAQYYIGTGRKFKSFAQFACANYGDTKPLGIPKLFAKPVFRITKMLLAIKPNMTMKYKPPKAKGFHAEIDDEFYGSVTSREPNFFTLKLNTLVRLLECIVGKDSLLINPITCPTLVFKTLHDRFFPKEYFDKYYNQLTCEKKLVEINDIHNSYFITPEPFIKEVAEWFNEH